jgi:2-polyprenyl-3-methyl-5-hydroxy-6-metoxy-1,4-benzoquinol methylase
MEEKIITGNVFDKYHTGNPVYKKLMQGFENSIYSFLSKIEEKTGKGMNILEVGCGEGELGKKILKHFKSVHYKGIDIEEEILRTARGNCNSGKFLVGSVYELSALKNERYDAIILSEVLEHLAFPQKAINELSGMESVYYIFSVPREPIWRILNLMRLKYITGLGNTPGHVQHWSKKRFIKLLNTRYEIMDLQSPLPWSVALCRKK